ncbi:hypothetical protein BB558_001996 [Smittium angustum]|uniref:WLM domain-containing protein n=1 Tax=Smittium angustum TaxID=133377 RepID=A0A2U1J9T7_SMIAN|nr:hypothetical protein BB558_001996 [Smittium angustum]
MEKRGWKVSKLTEFFPKDRFLLGININKTFQIKIRLREPHNYNNFIRYEDLLGTLLHELVHIIRSPHDDEFYMILLELKRELATLIIKGFRGEGFLSDGKKLGSSRVQIGSFLEGTNGSNDIKRKMQEAAERRYYKTKNNAKQNSGLAAITGGSSVNPTNKADIRQMMANAAEKRLGMIEKNITKNTTKISNNGKTPEKKAFENIKPKRIQLENTKISNETKTSSLELKNHIPPIHVSLIDDGDTDIIFEVPIIITENQTPLKKKLESESSPKKLILQNKNRKIGAVPEEPILID